MSTRTKHQFHYRHFRVAECTFANLPSAAERFRELMQATNVGGDSTLFTSDGSFWRPVNGLALLGKTDIFLGIAPTFTARAGGVDGKVTFGTSLVRTGGLKGYFYYPANSLKASHSAGFYYTVMTDGTSGTVYADTYTPGGAAPVIPASPTTLTGTVQGGTGVTTEVSMVSRAIAAGMLNKTGSIEYKTQLENNNNADDKTLKVKLGSTVLKTVLATTSTETAVADRVWNAGARNVQASASTSFAGAVDTSAATTVSITLTNEAATSWSLIPYSEFVLRS